MRRPTLVALFSLLVITPLAVATAQSSGPVYLPVIAREATLTPTATTTTTPTATPTTTPTATATPTGCQPAPEEQAIADRMLAHPEQARPALRCHPILERVARERALDMAVRGYESHVNPDGFGPNYLVRQAGYPLSSTYSSSLTANSIEVMYFGYGFSPTPNPDNPWNWWMNSSIHRTMLLGLTSFFVAQDEYGVGHVYVPGSNYGHYWIVLTARQ
ncbi:MAG: hypothetical protein JNL73_20490 [Anaerolineales bacterium]|nr:hypothetical protein [Anaerolineales bacterium]